MSDSRPILAIVDFADDAHSAPVRMWFEAPVRELRADTLAEVLPALDEAERLARAGLWMVGFVSYDASPAFDAAFDARRDDSIPLAWFAAFAAPAEQRVNGEQFARLGHAHRQSGVENDSGEEPESLAISTTVSDRAYDTSVERIRAYVAAGDVYQVNLTVPFTCGSPSSTRSLYERMRSAQSGRYSAYIDMGGIQIMSASPELFLERRGTTLRSRPMKGTAARGLDSESDDTAREALIASEKDRAENVMIVDVVRNDLGRIAHAGSVRVTSLFEAERYPRVWQLTSTVEAEVDAGLPLSELFGALFPPASITGAPKIRATQIISELEATPRAVYCGSIGVIRPGGDATFNVAIRTAWSTDGGQTLHLNAGGGVTIDSTPAGELAELHTKLTAFTLPGLRPSLFETIRVEHGMPVRLERHLRRIASSAEYFGISFDAEQAREFITERAARSGALPVARCRFALSPDSLLSATLDAFVDAHSGGPRTVAPARVPIDRDDVRLYHKTTLRDLYDAALSDTSGAFDVLLWNAAGEATELTRGNLVAELDGERWTPPVVCGLLGGTLRAELLELGEIRERVLPLDVLPRASRLWFINSLRGWVPITLVRAP